MKKTFDLAGNQIGRHECRQIPIQSSINDLKKPFALPRFSLLSSKVVEKKNISLESFKKCWLRSVLTRKILRHLIE